MRLPTALERLGRRRSAASLSAGMAELAAEDVPKLKLAWVFGFEGVNRA